MKKKEIINIDDKEYEFTSGETIIQVARRNDIYIPNLCYIEGLAPFGSCRLCVVKIPGARKQYQAACATPATDGLKVITKNEDLQEMRREVLQMLLSEHPNNCLICGHNGVCKDLNINHEKKISQRIFGCFSCPRKEDCELRTLVKYLEITELTYDFSYKNIEVEDNDLFFDRDYNLCILCGKCVRMCSEFRGMHILDFIERGHDTIVSTPMSLLHKDTNCQFCGSCIDICPVGVYKAKGSNWQIPKDNIIETTCGFCSLGCEFKLLYNDKKELVECQPVNMDKKSINKG